MNWTGKNLVLLLISLCLTIGLQAQKRYASRSKKAIAYYETAIKLMEQRDYKSVLDNIGQALAKDNKFTDAYLLTAEVYRLLNNPEEEAKAYEKAIQIDPGYFPYVFYNLGEVYYKMGEYRKGMDEFQRFIDSGKGKPVSMAKARNFIEKCQQAQYLKDNPVPFEPKNLGNAE